MTITEDEEKGWFHINDIDKVELKDKEITFNALDLKEWWHDHFDSWWLQIKDDKVCLSYEGFSYEPHYFGEIRKKGSKKC